MKMKKILMSDADYASAVAAVLNRTPFNSETDAAVASIIDAVRQRGDAALCEFAEKFDGFKMTPDMFAVSDAEISEAVADLSEEIRTAVDIAVAQVQDFSRQNLPRPWSYSPRPGVTLGEQYHPLDRVGCYVPGGTAPLISTVVHTVAIASAAGVKEIVVCTPPGKDGGKVNPALLYACKKAGATEIYRLGGVYAIAAMAFGTESIRKVEKIMGPGNAYVAAAKRQVYGQVALDLVAGPSEIMIVADESANPAFVAADILSQAEHGSGREQAVLAATSAKMIDDVIAQVKEQAARLPRQECVTKVLENGVFLIEVPDLDKAAEIAGEYAPEHLELMVENPEALAPKVKAAGAIFMGHWTPEPVGDFVAGPSHVLPTGGTGKFFSGLTVDMFFRRSSTVKYDCQALQKEIPYVECFARCEGLAAHGNSGSIRRVAE